MKQVQETVAKQAYGLRLSRTNFIKHYSIVQQQILLPTGQKSQTRNWNFGNAVLIHPETAKHNNAYFTVRPDRKLFQYTGVSSH